MRRLCMFVFSLLLLHPPTGQAQSDLPLNAVSVVAPRENGTCGAPLLYEKEQQLLANLAQHPEWRDSARLRKTAWNFTVGSQKSWYADDFRTQQRYLVPSTCRAVGTRCYIFVEDALWLDTVTQSAVDAFRVAFDSSTPASATQGIYQTTVDAFGATPNVDSDAKIIVMILDIKDQFSNTGTGGFIGGYFTSQNQFAGPQSNLAEMVYIDADPVPLTNASGLQFALSTLAHEFQHLIHFNYDTNELTFINEGCSLAAEVICGYPIYDQSYFVSQTNVNLLSWQREISDYSRAARFMTYLRDQVGAGVFKPLVQNAQDGVLGLDAALQSIGTPLRFAEIFQNFTIANILDDRTVNPAYAYTYPNLPKATGRLLANPNVGTTNGVVQLLAGEYLSFKYGENLRARFTVSNPSIIIKAVEIGPTSKRVLDVTPGVDFVEPAYGSTYREVHFVVTNTSQAFPYGYPYQASGTAKPIELKWDTTEPAGFLRFSVSDTQCVTFDAVPGGRVDSIRIALRRAGAITGGIWQFTGVTRPTPLGKRLAFPITASTTLTPPVVSPGSAEPYPKPYPNWRKVDLTSFNISSDKPFVAAFVIRSPDTPAVMITRYPGQAAYNSFTYLNNPTGGSSARNWYYVSADENSVWIYLIRAYVSFPSTGVRETVELSPSTFFLAQNYPNPFNPSTTIEFSLPKASRVTLKIFNALGEEVATLLQEKRAAGKHHLAWNAANLASGVYMYRLEGEGFVETKRLVLMK